MFSPVQFIQHDHSSEAPGSTRRINGVTSAQALRRDDHSLPQTQGWVTNRKSKTIWLLGIQH